ncbi:MAG: DUF721 domain-containing protein [Deltaproteobacteria bacterium]|nr:DUF721 domain-containing protein [Deltaproteobacteria bacterium]
MKEPIPIDATIGKILEKRMQDLLTMVKILSAWEFMPEKIIKGAIPVSYKKGTLRIAVYNSVWKQEVAFQSIVIIEKLKSIYPEMDISGIKIFISKDAFRPELTGISRNTDKKPKKPSFGSPAYQTYLEIYRTASSSQEQFQEFFKNISKSALDLEIDD